MGIGAALLNLEDKRRRTEINQVIGKGLGLEGSLKDQENGEEIE